MRALEKELKLYVPELTSATCDIQTLDTIFSLIMSASPDVITANGDIVEQIIKRVLPHFSEAEKNCILNKLRLLKQKGTSTDLSEYDLIKHARFGTPAELEEIASKPDLPISVTSILVARGFLEAIHALTANNSAKLSRSSISMIIELASSDFKLKENLTRRTDIPEAFLMRLLPYLNQNQTIQLLTADFSINDRTAIQYLANERRTNLGNGIDPSRAIEDTISRLCTEMRLYEIADILSKRLYTPLALTMNFLNSRMDYCRALILNAAGADENSVFNILGLKQINNFRLNSDINAVHYVYQNYTLEKASNFIDSCLEKARFNGLIGLDMMHDPNLFFVTGY